jgi:hypothetical protein
MINVSEKSRNKKIRKRKKYQKISWVVGQEQGAGHQECIFIYERQGISRIAEQEENAQVGKRVKIKTFLLHGLLGRKRMRRLARAPSELGSSVSAFCGALMMLSCEHWPKVWTARERENKRERKIDTWNERLTDRKMKIDNRER